MKNDLIMKFLKHIYNYNQIKVNKINIKLICLIELEIIRFSKID